MSSHSSTLSARGGNAAGFSLLELLVAVTLLSLVMGVTMTAVGSAKRVNDSVVRMTEMNNALRAAMDMMVRDLLQVGSGLPPGHVIAVPSGAGATAIRLPGPVGSNYTTTAAAMSAVLPRPGAGPTINGVATDVLTVLMADNAFTDVPLTAITSTTVTVAANNLQGQPVNLTVGADRVVEGQLMMIEKGSISTLVQVTNVNVNNRRLTFGTDSLNLNQTGAAAGTLARLNAAAPANSPANTRISRVRMISYYLDTTIAGRPRLMRRINNGHPTDFDNNLGTALAFEVENLTFSYDLANADNNTNVRFTATDLTTGGACSPEACALNQITKVNIVMTARSNNATRIDGTVFRNSLTTQVSLRGMAFVDEYKAP
jgi:prepilin-type N-terminal cleavage/methylation domain-containing protein